MNILFSLLIFSLPFGVLFRFGIAPNVFLYPQDVFAGLIFLAFLVLLLQKRVVVEKKLFILAALFLSLGFVSPLLNSSYLRSEQFLASFAYLVRFASYLSIIYAVPLLNKKYIARLKPKMIAAGSLFTVLGFIQYFYYPNLKNLYYLGWDEHLGRMFSTFLDPNFAGAFLVLVLILTITNIKKSKLHTLLSCLILVAIFLTHSRSAIIMLFVSGVVFLVANKLHKHIALLMLVLVSGLIIFSNTQFEGLNPFRIASTEARIDSAREAIIIFSKKPILGVGFNAYRYAKDRYIKETTKSQFQSNSDAGTDNSYLFVLATAGVVGFLVFLDFWFNILKRVYKESAVFAAVAGLLVNTLFINSVFYTPIMAWVFILIGTTLSRRR